MEHWKAEAGHKKFCVSVDKRKPPIVDIAAKKNVGDECAICLDPLSSSNSLTLSCSHEFHAECVENLRKLCAAQVCPLCRVDLPEGTEKLLGKASHQYFAIERKVLRGEMTVVEF